MEQEKRLRYHLGRGEFYKHWQLKSSRQRSKAVYFNPEDTSFILKGVKLYSKRSAAQKIYEGSNKNVCAWLSIEGSVKISSTQLSVEDMTEIAYNPRVAPFWTYKGIWCEKEEDINLDMKKFDKVIINKTKIYVQ